ncbi:MAG: (d)CMP kinase [Armatimonadetes bacterium]|nr:(d)CMP kinase [Armatimonadota bacterium]
MRKLIIAVDGPAGSGKSTVARGVATRLGYTYIDSGAMYRAVAWKMREEGVDPADARAVTCIARQIRLEFRPVEGQQHLFVDGVDVSEAIRAPEISRLSSIVSAIPGVRQAMVQQQRRIGAGGGVVMEGRDIGTVVFPHADLKIYLDAALEERARRRCAELQSRGTACSYQEVLREMVERDARDKSRAHSPLRPAPDAVRIDTTGLTAEQVIDRIVDLARERQGNR